ncbi:EAL domain-containing response regulator [Shewanella olleyana]|uniref:EAL domain-containing response regulator n=1 Tax=Shewanella olleyana TaxID=135626 RepID=UPI00200C7521|nr:EAL domain-containing response regulator [Shewanella olleyana]MCL1066308.1 EAL domain-containing response regulator [Shewanella olleyana]
MYNLNSIKILNIEDDEFQRIAISMILRGLGYKNITEANDGAEAINKLKNEKFDIVITDINMPNTSGIQLISYLNQFHCDIAVIVVTAMEDDILQLIESMSYHQSFSYFDIIKKPFYKSDFERILTNVMIKGIQAKRHKMNIDIDSFESALANGDIINYYQPQVGKNSDDLQGVEALVRWQHEKYGILSPINFLSFCENNIELDMKLFETVLSNAINDCKKYNITCQVSVNISQKCIEHPALLKVINSIIDRTNFDISLLTLELTESDVYSETLQMLLNLCELKYNKVKLSIDDFGTGYSSLKKLVNYPFSELKIDRSFIFDCANNNTTDTVTKLSIALAHQLGLSVVAEGIEDKETLDHLVSLGIDKYQGFFTGKPMLPAELENFYIMQ